MTLLDGSIIMSIFENAESISILVAVLVAILASVWKFANVKTKSQKKEESLALFNDTIVKLTSENIASQLSAAVLLRNFLNLNITEKGEQFLFKDTIGVMTGMLKVLPTGVYQKALGDGLAYAKNLTMVDLQKTNLQNIYLGVKSVKPLQQKDKINLTYTDFFLADLTDALIQNAYGKAIFYDALLCNANIKDCDFRGANFRSADLRGANFSETYLEGACFANAINIPEKIKPFLDEKGYFSNEVGGIFKPKKEEGEPSPEPKEKKPINIFFSMPGTILDANENRMAEWQKYLENDHHFSVTSYKRDQYHTFGQLSEVRKKIGEADALVCFGVKQIHILDAEYRPKSNDENSLKDQWISTPWCEIEVSMAFERDIPILLVTDEEISTGIFDTVISERRVLHLSIKDDLRNLQKNPNFRLWLDQIPNR